MQLFARTTLIAASLAATLPADVSYRQTMKYKGGSVVEMAQKMASNPIMGRMGGGMKQAFEDQTSEIYVKGNKMARVGSRLSTIYDLDAGTITTISHDRQSYSVQTFEELTSRMQETQKRMNKGGNDIQFDVKVNNTDRTRQIDGVTAKETVMTLTAKQATEQGQMVVTVHAWLVPMNDLQKEVRDFDKRLAEKFAAGIGGGMSPMMGSASAGLGAAMREMSRLNSGYPAVSESVITGVSGAGGPMAAMAAMNGGAEKTDPNAPLIDTETSNEHFVKGVADDSKFSVPAGYKEEKSRRR